MVHGEVKVAARRRPLGEGAQGDKSAGIVTSLPPGIAPSVAE